MKNNYMIDGDKTLIFVDRVDGERVEIIVDTNDLGKIKTFNNSWGATKKSGNRWIIKGTYRENKVKKNISLSRYIVDAPKGVPVRFLNNNPLDHRRENLTIGYEVQIAKGNEYYIIDDIAFIIMRRKNGDSIITKIDLEDLDRVLEKGTWFPEWHRDFNNYFAQNVAYNKTNNRRKRKKVSLHTFILGLDSKKVANHKDNDTLNNCKSNLRVYEEEMINDYIYEDDHTVAIILRDKDGYEKARSLIDEEDLMRVYNNGYTWFYFNANGNPYAVANTPEGRKYLHRFIMRTPDNMVTDHINHNTLDNRKSNLCIATTSQNQQNRRGPRSGSKSDYRGVSWDDNNQDWLVVVQGIYFGRFKDLEDAKKLADQKIDELMPYLHTIGKRK